MGAREGIALLLLIFISNLLISIFVVRSPLYSQSQKSLQILLVWLIPVVGAIVVWQVLRAHQEQIRPSRSDARSQEESHAALLATKLRRKDEPEGDGPND